VTPDTADPRLAGSSTANPVPALDQRVLDAAKRCSERWGIVKTSIDDVASEAGVSRATVYRLFPGGKDVLFEALRARERSAFFEDLTAHLSAADSFEDLVVHGVVFATRLLQADEQLGAHLASEPGAILPELTLQGLPRIFDAATVFLTPWFAPHVGLDRSAQLAEWLSRVVVSYFLAPSAHVDLADEASARSFVRSFVLPAFDPTISERE
jgi:AcrR family transcriptional regulator